MKPAGNTPPRSLFKRILRILVLGILVLLFLVAVVITGLALYAPPSAVKPQADQGAEGVPALPLPEGQEESYEPSVSIDPADANHIVVMAQYGRRFGRAGTAVYQWSSTDGGRSWFGSTVPAAKFGGIFAADPVTAVGDSGVTYFISMFEDHAVPNSPFALGFWLLRGGNVAKKVEGGVAVARTADGGHTFPSPVVVAGTEKGDKLGDKTWLAVDNSPTSSFRGSVYTSWAIFERTGKRMGSLNLVFAFSRDGGRTFSAPKTLAKSAYGVQLVVRPSGVVDALFESQDRKAILHSQSSNGGEAFTSPEVVAPTDGDTLRGLPTLAVSDSGALLACWPENKSTVKTDVVCENSEDGSHWSRPIEIVPGLPEETIVAYPAAASTGQVWWVLAYRSDNDSTQVVVYRSVDHAASFTPTAVLARRRFGSKSFCDGVGHSVSCRFNPFVRDFVPGDYVGLAGTHNRIAAAFVMPRNDDPVAFANVYARVMDVPPETNSWRITK